MLDFTHQERRVMGVLLFAALLGAVVFAWQEWAGATRWEEFLAEDFAPGAVEPGRTPVMAGASPKRPSYLWAALLPHLPEAIPPGNWLAVPGVEKPPGLQPAALLSPDSLPVETGEEDTEIQASERRLKHLPYHRVGKPRLVGVPININRASAGQLQMLPGIGPKLAERIIRLRAERGGFVVPEELMAVKGIGQKKFEKIKDLITTGGSGNSKGSTNSGEPGGPGGPDAPDGLEKPGNQDGPGDP